MCTRDTPALPSETRHIALGTRFTRATRFSNFHSFIIVLSLGIYYLYCRVFFSGMLVDSDRMTCIT